jgi:hypothetical protein
MPPRTVGRVSIGDLLARCAAAASGATAVIKLRAALAPYELPRMVLVENIPRLETGKVDRDGVAAFFGKQT